MTGILPTLRAEELRLAALSDARRFRALDNGIRRLRHEPSRVRIDGADPLELAVDDVALEGANTSFQVHLRVDPERFTATYNAVQLATGPVLAVAGNSPTFLGRRLWEETRVALFKQVVDDRDAAGKASRRVCRVAFGTGWVRDGAAELLEDSVRLHEPIMPVLAAERPLDRVDGGQVPALEELRLHQGTVWTWNRAIYDPTAGGHLRVEMRALPAGRPWSTCSPTPRSTSASRSRSSPTPAPGPAGCRSSRPTTTSTARPSSGSEPRWRGRSTRAGGSARCPSPSWPGGCCPPPGRAWSRPVSPATRSTGCSG
jgi:hypothetical protein